MPRPTRLLRHASHSDAEARFAAPGGPSAAVMGVTCVDRCRVLRPINVRAPRRTLPPPASVRWDGRPTHMAGSHTALREANRVTVVHAIRRYGGLIQVELAATTGLSAATVSNIVREFQQAGEANLRATIHNGRRAMLVTMVHRTGLAADVHVRTRHMSIGLTDSAHPVFVEQALLLPHEHHARHQPRPRRPAPGRAPRARRLQPRRAARHRHRPAGAHRRRDRHRLLPRHPARLGRRPLAQMMSKRLGVPVFADKAVRPTRRARRGWCAGSPHSGRPIRATRRTAQRPRQLLDHGRPVRRSASYSPTMTSTSRSPSASR
jgi:hypothetical protein